MAKYTILRPPLIASFELPTHQDLLELTAGDSAKLIFQVGNDKPERMWVKLTDCSDPNKWSGLVDTDAVQDETKKTLPADIEVSFHPLDIIQTTD